MGEIPAFRNRQKDATNTTDAREGVPFGYGGKEPGERAG